MRRQRESGGSGWREGRSGGGVLGRACGLVQEDDEGDKSGQHQKPHRSPQVHVSLGDLPPDPPLPPPPAPRVPPPLLPRPPGRAPELLGVCRHQVVVFVGIVIVVNQILVFENFFSDQIFFRVSQPPFKSPPITLWQ